MKSIEDTFKSPRACWESTPANVRKFITDRKCQKLAKYHEAAKGCSTFDRWVSGIAGHKRYHATFFTYYAIVGPIDQPRFAPYGMVDRRELSMLKRYEITKRYAVDLVEENIEVPELFEDWPSILRPEEYLSTLKERRMLLKSIESCIARRQEFRKMCVVACSNRIKGTGSHDQFLIILQILRAKVITIMQ